jgi:outer membrane protein OmpA-like peptidoglycan-associated protein
MRFLLLLLAFLPFTIQAQNLLMNGDFEEENICTEFTKNCAPEAWISTSLFADYFFDDEANAFSGKHFTGLILVRNDRPAVRNFLRSRLLCGLRKDAQYKLEFYIRSHHRIFDSVGIYFSANDFLYQRDRILNAKPQLFINKDSSLQTTNEWQKVELLYTASGEENYINIGDFKPRGHDFKKSRPDLDRSFYFFLDKISLTPVNATEKLCSGADSIRKEEYAFDMRHDQLDRLIYANTKNPPPVVSLPKTILQRIDTLILPDVLFAINSFTLSSKANAVLDSLLAKTKSLQIDSLVIEGHTDNQGVEELNKKLSNNRAASVAAYLQKTITTEFILRGWASEKPIADNRTPAGRQKNRRVEIYIYVRE